MEAELIPLSSILLNDKNPRTITDDKFNKLIESVLTFPKMIYLRPIVVDSKNVVIGGNMRLKALLAISQMFFDELNDRLAQTRRFQMMTVVERGDLASYWANFLNNPQAPVLHAADLSEEELKEFIIKDNTPFGSWDMDMLKEEWDEVDLLDWGMDLPGTVKSLGGDDEEDGAATIDTKLIVQCQDAGELEKLFNELQGRGFTCKLKE